MDRLSQRLRYEEIAAGYYEHRVVTGYEVQLPCGAHGVGESLGEAFRAAVHARDTHRAKVERLRWAAEDVLHKRASERGEIPF